ncbi:MAG: NAD-dependent epimerase/dehydratase family protein [Lishizhenia sp.]
MKVIVTGSTGMVGKAILLECLDDDRITEVLVLNRRSLEIQHAKLKEVIIEDFFHLTSVDFSSYDACFHAMGVSSVGMNEEKYNRFTFDVTTALVEKLYKTNQKTVFNYVSGQGTDSTEKGKLMWARVKGKTENMILNKGFKDAYMFRIGGLIPEKGVKSKTKWVNLTYFIFKPVLFILRKPLHLVGSSNVGKAMINTLFFAQEEKILNNKKILEISMK